MKRQLVGLMTFVMLSLFVARAQVSPKPIGAPKPTTALAPLPVKPSVRVVQPKDSIAWEKLQLNRSQYTIINTRFVLQEQQEFIKTFKPALDNLDAQAATLINEIRQENNWDSGYVYSTQSGQWTTTKAESKK